VCTSEHTRLYLAYVRTGVCMCMRVCVCTCVHACTCVHVCALSTWRILAFSRSTEESAPDWSELGILGRPAWAPKLGALILIDPLLERM